MAELSYSCSVSQGFNFQKDEQSTVGHLVECKIGDKKLKNDLQVTDPEDNTKKIDVVGVLSGIFWNGGYADPIQLSCQVSNANKITIATLTHKSLANTAVTCKFDVFDFDPKKKKYYKCFHTNKKDLKGLIFKSGGNLAMDIEMDQSMEIVSPKNFGFTLGVMPEEQKGEQQVHVAVSVSDKFAKQWGVPIK